MDRLFGIPTQPLMWILLCVFGAGFLILAALALRDRTSFRMAVRNVPRRRAQTALIVVGLMLATLLFSAAFTTGDTLTNSLRVQALENIGRVDVAVKAEQPESGGGSAFGPGAGGPAAPASRERYFDEDLAGKVRDRLAGENVAGVAPLARETAPVTSSKTDLSEPRVDVLGMDAASMENFDGLTTASGKVLALGELGTDEVYVSRETAEGLGVGKGDKVETALLLRSEQPWARSPTSRRRSSREAPTEIPNPSTCRAWTKTTLRVPATGSRRQPKATTRSARSGRPCRRRRTRSSSPRTSRLRGTSPPSAQPWNRL
jgi:putative ABC transport system permease protein